MGELLLSSEHYAFGYSNMLLTYCSTSRQRKDLTAQACWLQFHDEPDEGRAWVARLSDESWSNVNSAKPRPSLLHLQDLTSPLMESANERKVNNLQNVKGKAGYN